VSHLVHPNRNIQRITPKDPQRDSSSSDDIEPRPTPPPSPPNTHESFSIIYISSDRTYEQFLDSIENTGFYFLPFHRPLYLSQAHRAARHALHLPSLPVLIILDRLENRIVSVAGVRGLMNYGEEAVKEWAKGRSGLKDGVWEYLEWRIGYYCKSYLKAAAVVVFHKLMVSNQKMTLICVFVVNHLEYTYLPFIGPHGFR
jgi:hypothetical protein